MALLQVGSKVGLTPIERLALMTAALCHDMEHPGELSLESILPREHLILRQFFLNLKLARCIKSLVLHTFCQQLYRVARCTGAAKSWENAQNPR